MENPWLVSWPSGIFIEETRNSTAKLPPWNPRILSIRWCQSTSSFTWGFTYHCVSDIGIVVKASFCDAHFCTQSGGSPGKKIISVVVTHPTIHFLILPDFCPIRVFGCSVGKLSHLVSCLAVNKAPLQPPPPFALFLPVPLLTPCTSTKNLKVSFHHRGHLSSNLAKQQMLG